MRRATYSTRLVENVPEETTAEVMLLSTSIIKGKRMFSEKDRFRKLRFEITSGHELIGSWFKRESFSIGFSHYILLTPKVSI